MAIIPSKKEEEADDMRLRISSFSGKKTDRAVEKGLITKEEAEKLGSTIDKLLYKYKNDWWLDRKGQKSYDTMMLMLEGFEAEKDILVKIEKA